MNTIHHNSDQTITGQACADLDLLSKLSQNVKMIESLDPDMAEQTIEDAIKYTISKTQENVQLI